jgi:hypothetical protein
MRLNSREDGQIGSSASFGLPKLLVAFDASRQSSSKAEKARILTAVCESDTEFIILLALATINILPDEF